MERRVNFVSVFNMFKQASKKKKKQKIYLGCKQKSLIFFLSFLLSLQNSRVVKGGASLSSVPRYTHPLRRKQEHLRLSLRAPNPKTLLITNREGRERERSNKKTLVCFSPYLSAGVE